MQLADCDSTMPSTIDTAARYVFDPGGGVQLLFTAVSDVCAVFDECMPAPPASGVGVLGVAVAYSPVSHAARRKHSFIHSQ